MIPLIGVLAPLIFGHKYAKSAGIFQLLAFVTILSFVVLPIEVAIYNLHKSKFIALSTYIQIIVVAILNVFTIPHYGMACAAINLIIGKIFHLIFLSRIFFKQVSADTKR